MRSITPQRPPNRVEAKRVYIRAENLPQRLTQCRPGDTERSRPATRCRRERQTGVQTLSRSVLCGRCRWYHRLYTPLDRSVTIDASRPQPFALHKIMHPSLRSGRTLCVMPRSLKQPLSSSAPGHASASSPHHPMASHLHPPGAVVAPCVVPAAGGVVARQTPTDNGRGPWARP